MIQPSQYKLPHIYAGAAKLNHASYRQVLKHHAGVSSCADRRMDQTGFEAVMAALETILFNRVLLGEVADPTATSRWIKDEYYWRGKLPKTGYINSRQAHRINELWAQLQQFLPDRSRTPEYLAGIIRQATSRRDGGYMALTTQEAGYLIDALTDRIRWAFKSANRSEVSDPEISDPELAFSEISNQQSEMVLEEAPF